jgi:hypothetical protein
MSEVQRFSDLSATRQVLVRLFQSLNFGQIQNLAIQAGEPIFDQATAVLVDVKLDVDEGPRPEGDLTDFTLQDEVRRLLARLDGIHNGTIARIEVRAGIPRRVIFERRLTDAPR